MNTNPENIRLIDYIDRISIVPPSKDILKKMSDVVEAIQSACKDKRVILVKAPERKPEKPIVTSSWARNDVPGRWEWCYVCLFHHDPNKECGDTTGWARPQD